MDADEFVTRLRAAMPSGEELEEYGLDEEEIRDIQATFIVKKNDTGQAWKGGCEVERLIREYDCSQLEIGGLRFAGVASEYPTGGQILGDFDNNPLVLNAAGEVIVCERVAPASVFMKCAVDCDRFLDALANFVCIRKDKSNWKGRATEAATRCAQLAGGNDCLKFYQVLCGFID
ncbi:hypothetical protein [Anatilimnocola floriformis]|uniref:hypothetical protein n=1 Tax=Anatilimnocola floriformis TaxID=2948575 RepID=UPI0020C3F4AF|nr:hypothetical protein [Anatilimnocola floriformis]